MENKIVSYRILILNVINITSYYYYLGYQLLQFALYRAALEIHLEASSGPVCKLAKFAHVN